MSWVGIVLFVVTYVLISARRLTIIGFDRPAAALLGAVACVLARVLEPGEALGAVNGPTLLLLFGVMGMGAFLALDGFFDHLEDAIARIAKTPTRLLGVLVWGAGILSAFITNDAVCVLGAPLVVRLIRRHRLPALPFLLALATAANTGSVATLVGNPQNMLCAMLGKLSYREHLLYVGPLAVVALGANHLWLAWFFRRDLAHSALEAASVEPPRPVLTVRTGTTLLIILGTAVAYTLGADLAWAATGGFSALMLLHRRDTRELWGRIDWPLLVFFAGLFVVVEGFFRSGGPAWLFEHFPLVGSTAAGARSLQLDFLGGFRLATVFLVGSNLVSNVPFILVVRDAMSTLAHPTLGWELLAVASTFAGNLTLLGSVANLIVAESAREVGSFGFVDHLKVGLPLALGTTALGTAWLVMIYS